MHAKFTPGNKVTDLEKRLVAKTISYENVIIHDCFEGLSAHKILNQPYIQTRLEIALVDKVIKLFLWKIQRTVGIRNPLLHPQHSTLLSTFTQLIKYFIISTVETTQKIVLRL